MLTLFTLPTDFTSGVASNSQALIASLSTPVELIIGVLLGATVITFLIRIFIHR